MDMHNFFRKIFGGIDHYPGFGGLDGKEFDDPSGDESMDPFSSVHSFLQEQLSDILEHFSLDSNFPNEITGPLNSNQSVVPFGRGTLRDSFLKSGFQDSCQAKPNTDNDLDDRAVQGSLSKFLDDNNSPTTSKSESQTQTFTHQPSVYSRSFISRTIRQPDGTYVTEKVTRDQDGNEEKSVTVHGNDEDTTDGLKPSPRGPFRFFF